MCKRALTLDNLNQPAGADCGCGPNCGTQTELIKDSGIIKNTALDVVDAVKETTEDAMNKAKIKMRNENFQKVALLAVGAVALYVIFK